MIENLIILAASLFFVVKGATWSTKYSVKIAESCRLSKYIIGFIVIAIISILPETFIAINSAVQGTPGLGLGTLFGSNVADLTLVFAIIIAFSGRGIKIQSTILKNNIVYPFLLLVPLILGFNGHYSRWEGLALIIIGIIFYYLAFKNSVNSPSKNPPDNRLKNIFFLIISLAVLLISSYFTVISAIELAKGLYINPIFIGIFIIGLGTTMPELIFSLKSVKRHDDSLAIGDILGTVLADATIVVGILALASPFYFPQKIIYATGSFMVLASFLLFYFMRSGKMLSKKESRLLFLFWLFYVMIEFFINR